jgi:hypothetical protein
MCATIVEERQFARTLSQILACILFLKKKSSAGSVL